MTAGRTQGSGRWADILTGRRGVYTLLLGLGTGVFAINQFVVSTIMPTVVGDLGGLRYYAWTFSLFAVGAIVGSASIGPVREAVGDRAAFVGASLVMAVGLAGAAIANDMLVLVGWRLLQGAGGGMLAAQAYGLVAIMYPEELRGRALGLVSTTWGVATLLGPGFGGVFAELAWWRGAFWALLPLALATAVLAWRTVPVSEARGKLSQVPYVRLALLGLSIVVLSAASSFDALWLRVGLTVASVALAAIAFRRDAAAEHRMFPRQVMVLLSEIGAANWMLLLFSIVNAFVHVYSAYFLQVLHGVTPLVVGYLIAIPSFAWTFMAIAVAPLRGPQQTVAIVSGMVLILIGALGIAATAASGPVWLITVFMSILGFGIGCMNNPVIQRVIQAAPETDKHVAGTATQTMRTLGIAFGAALAGLIGVAAGLAGDALPRAVVASAMDWVYEINVIFGVLALLAVFPFLAGYRKRMAKDARARA